MDFTDQRPDQSLDMAAIVWRSHRTIFEFDPMLLAATFEGVGVEFAGIVEMKRIGNAEDRIVELDLPFLQPSRLPKHGMPNGHAHRRGRRAFERNVEARDDPRRDVDLQRECRSTERPAEMLVDDDYIGGRVIHLDDLQGIVR